MAKITAFKFQRIPAPPTEGSGSVVAGVQCMQQRCVLASCMYLWMQFKVVTYFENDIVDKISRAPRWLPSRAWR